MNYNIPFKKLLETFEHKKPEIVFEWNDRETEARGWIVINSLRGGAAGGGTRMRKGLDQREVESLAKTMEVKFSICGPNIGGAKSGINFDPADPRKEGVLKRWYQAVMPLLKTYYGTGGDLNVDEIHEVIPITSSYGLLHPQEGVVNGHLKADGDSKKKRIEQLQIGVSKVLDNALFSPDVAKGYTVADMITGWGVAESVRHYYNIWGGSIVGKNAVVQGWGNVGAAAAWYLAKMGASIVGIIDRSGGIIERKGLSFEQVGKLFHDKQSNTLVADNLLSFEETQAQVWDLGCEIFIPAAASRLVTQEQCEKLVAGGIEVIACGANVPFADAEIFIGPIADYIDDHTGVVPDFIANCGMARVFAYLMQENVALTDEAIFKDASETIRKALTRLNQFNQRQTGLSKKALEMSLSTLV
ncbi:MAG: Glu/Leu/Phe/Val dehydrogenase dimerization domain-containing protein [Bacteroidota bacterium]|nr:Glu/Leu/Phe/Val dehydrogenase dimerization domain-containing protein [Bacteroidota bacterium]